MARRQATRTRWQGIRRRYPDADAPEARVLVGELAGMVQPIVPDDGRRF